MIIINTCLGLFHITAIRTLAYDDPQCSRSLKLSALVFRLRLNRPHSWPPPPTYACFAPQPFFLLLSIKASLYHVGFAYISVQLTYVYRMAPNACWPCWLHYLQCVFHFWDKLNDGRKKQIWVCILAQTQHRDGKSWLHGRNAFMSKERSQTVKVGVIIERRIHSMKEKLLGVSVQAAKIASFNRSIGVLTLLLDLKT